MNIGQKTSRIRKILGIKQKSVAQALGLSRQTMSKIEHSDAIDDIMLDKIASILGITSKAIKQFNEETFPEYFKDNTICDQTCSGVEHPDDFSDLIEKMKIENKRLEERLIKSEQEKIQLLRDLG